MRRSLLALAGALLLNPTARPEEQQPGQAPAAAPGQGDSPDVGLDLPAADQRVGEAIALFRRRDLEGAMARLEEASRANPDLGPPGLLMAKLFLLDNQGPNGRAQLERAAAEAPDAPDVWLTLGKVALAEGRLAEAGLAFEKARGLVDAARLGDERKRALRMGALAGLAAAAERRKDWRAAEAAARAWLAEDAGNVEARRRVAQASFYQGKADQALAELKKAATLDPKATPPAVVLAMLATERDDLEAAETYLKQAAAAQPGDGRVRRAYAAWLLDRGRPEEAKKEADAAAKASPDDDDVRLVAALVALRLGQHAESESALRALHEKAPGNFLISDRWARALAAQDDPAKRQRAQQIAEMNLRLYPNNAQAIATGAAVARALGNLDRAEALLRSAVGGGQASSEIAYELARLVAERRGARAPEVANLVQVALDASGPFPHREEAKAWLATLPRPDDAGAASDPPKPLAGATRP
jgi:Tfp pilus assembly protein PilF